MIKTREDLDYYLLCDKTARGEERPRPRLWGDRLWKLQILYRKSEYHYNNREKLWHKLAYVFSDVERGDIVAISALIVPLFDVLRVAVHRIRKGRNPFMPDRNHIHHKLLRAGMPKRYVVLTIVGLSLFYMVFNYYLNPYLNVTYILLIDFALWICLHGVINHFIKKVEGIPHSI